MDNNQIIDPLDPLAALVANQNATLGRESIKPESSNDVINDPQRVVPLVGIPESVDVEPAKDELGVPKNPNPFIPPSLSEEDIYGENDLQNEIDAENEADAALRAMAGEEMLKQKQQEESEKYFTPPDEYNMQYHNEALEYQQDKLNIVTGMVNRVVAKYKLISGSVEELPNPELGTIGKMAVMGELIDLYHKNGEKITREFEEMILKNWVMPNGTLAINNINDDGVVVDRTITNDASTKITNDVPNEEKPKESPTININVEKGTPVTVNVDESIVANTIETNEVNIYVREISEEEMLKTTVVENSDIEGIISAYDSGINDVPITLPLSGYRCVMRSINWADFIKLTAPTSNNSTDNELKKWSVIYDHLKNPSIGEFTDFEDFLKKTKYQDREVLMWGLLVATADDEEVLSLTCGNENCKNKIRVKYHPRTIFHLDEEKIPQWYVKAYEAAPGPEAVKIWEEVNNKRIRYMLPHKHEGKTIIVEINQPSAYEYLTNKLPLIETLFKRYRPNGTLADIDPEDTSLAEFDYYASNALFVSSMSIIQPNSNKEYRYTKWEQIENIIRIMLDATNSASLLAIIRESRERHVSPVSFRVEDITCNACGKHIDYVPINDIGTSLLFQVSRRLSNTQINLIEMD